VPCGQRDGFLLPYYRISSRVSRYVISQNECSVSVPVLTRRATDSSTQDLNSQGGDYEDHSFILRMEATIYSEAMETFY
jgi:hypothetical protein